MNVPDNIYNSFMKMLNAGEMKPINVKQLNNITKGLTVCRVDPVTDYPSTEIGANIIFKGKGKYIHVLITSTLIDNSDDPEEIRDCICISVATIAAPEERQNEIKNENGGAA